MTDTAARRGDASQLPAGRLASFEDDDSESTSDLSGLLARRVPPAAATPQPRSRPVPPRPADPEPAAAPAPSPPTPPAGQDQPTQPAPSNVPLTPAGDSAPAAEAAGNGRPVIRSTTVHIPVDLLIKIHRERDRTGLSNGEIIVTAIEATASRLPELIDRRSPAGGGLFERRSTRGARLADGPLTALNIRLFAQDFTVIDRLVQEYGAFSRGHLITTALNDYLPGQPHPDSAPEGP